MYKYFGNIEVFSVFNYKFLITFERETNENNKIIYFNYDVK